MKIKFFPSAQAELDAAFGYYEQQAEGLGPQFAEEIQQAIARILRFPNSWTKLSGHTRRCTCRRFPYSVVYQIRDNNLFIVSIMHMKKEPNSWRSYLPQNDR